MTDPQLAAGDAPRQIDNRPALLRLAVVVFGGIALAWAAHGLAVLVVVVSLVAMVMLHELGHFATAKWSGMKVTEYFLGFGPRLWSVRRGETEYGVKAIPAGGYVRIVGMTTIEDVDPADESRSYRQASFRARFAVGVAGSTVHFLLALLLIFVMLVGTGYPTAAPADEVSAVPTLSRGLSPAEAAGLQVGDELIGINGHRTSLTAVREAIADHPDSSLRLLVERHGAMRTVVVRPKSRQEVGLTSSAPKGSGDGVIGIELGGGTIDVRQGVLGAIPHTATLFGTIVADSIKGIGDVFSPHGLRSFAHQVASASNTKPKTTTSGNTGQLISIVGAVQIGSQVAGRDPSELIYLLVAINVFVGLVNLFPMLPLDGGHVVIAIYERVRSRRGQRYHADVRKLMPVAYAFLAFIVAIGLGALYANILHPVSLPGG